MNPSEESETRGKIQYACCVDDVTGHRKDVVNESVDTVEWEAVGGLNWSTLVENSANDPNSALNAARRSSSSDLTLSEVVSELTFHYRW